MHDEDHPDGAAAERRAAADRAALLGNVVEELPLGIYRTTMDGEFVAVNDEFVSLLGAADREELLAHRAPEFYATTADREALIETLDREGVLRDHEIALETLTGERLWVTTTVALVEEGDDTFVEGAIRDVTERKRTEADLTEYRERLSQVTESSQDVLWLFDAGFDELLFINDAYETVWGRPVAELEDDPRQFLESVHDADREDVVAAMGALGEGDAVDVEYRITTGAGDVRWVWSKGAPVFDDDGAVYRVAGFSRDVTERKETEEQLREYRERLEATVEELQRSNEELEQFAYVASHDLQEPLRMVSSYVDLLAAEYGDELDEEADEYVEYAVDGARRMKEMINGLLEYSRVHTDAGEFDEVDAGELVEAARADLGMRIDEADATVTVGDLPAVRADPAQFRQVVQNLIDNALTHGGAAPTVEVSAAVREDAVVVSVADDGPGVDPASQEEIFEIFTRGGGADDGSGIGLAVCRRIVERHGGEIWVDSEPGAGTTVSFSLPQPPGEPDDAVAVDLEGVDA